MRMSRLFWINVYKKLILVLLSFYTYEKFNINKFVFLNKYIYFSYYIHEKLPTSQLFDFDSYEIDV